MITSEQIYNKKTRITIRMFHCEDVVQEIAKFMCLHEQAQTFGVVCQRTARTVLFHFKAVTDLRDLNARPECMCSALSAAKVGHFACLRYVHENKEELVVDVDGNKWVCNAAILNNHIACFCYALDNGYPCDPGAVAHIVHRGNLELLQYAHEHDAHWDSRICDEAAWYGHLYCLQYAHEHGCPWDKNMIAIHCVRPDNIACLQYVIENDDSINLDQAIVCAIRNNSTRCLQYLRKHKQQKPNPDKL